MAEESTNIMTVEDFQLATLDLAPKLLGCRLVRRVDGEILAGRIVEVEAYHQDGDRASHSFAGKTRRNRVMFGPPGFLYVYFIYGMHYCMNVVTEAEGIGAAILIRAIQPERGLATMRRNRGGVRSEISLSNGPAKCCQALAIGKRENGISLAGPELYLERPGAIGNVIRSTRIGITKSMELNWRFYLENNPYVSKMKPAG